jgi:hypothetical protein
VGQGVDGALNVKELIGRAKELAAIEWKIRTCLRK